MDGINFFDGAVMGFVQEHCHNPVTDVVFSGITFLGEAGVFWIVLSLVLFFFKRTRRCGLLALYAIAFSFLISELCLKNIVCRPRPFQMFPEEVSLLLPGPSGYSFPSSHAATSFAVATVYFCCLKKWGIPALVLAALIGFSRVVLFFHWPTDVLAGAVLGIASALVVLWIVPKIEAKRRKTEEALKKE